MNESQLSWLENRLEQLVEGAFSSLFGKKITSRDLALELTRSMEDAARGDIAPDQYVIFLHPDIQSNILLKHDSIEQDLSQYMRQLCGLAGYRLQTEPQVVIRGKTELNKAQILIQTQHASDTRESTHLIPAIPMTLPEITRFVAQLIINTGQATPLSKAIINIGRGDDNDIILDDPFVSRRHVQLRQRQGKYILFDIESKGGTKVNNTLIRQHQLRSGDVIQIGNSQLVYVEDSQRSEQDTTQSMKPLNP